MPLLTILHFTGYARDTGGVLSAIRGPAPHNGCRNIIVVSSDFQQTRPPHLRLLRIRLPSSWSPESLYSPWTWLTCLRLTIFFRQLLLQHKHIIFHGHSRSGLAIAFLLDLLGHRRVLATVHANARCRFFIRLARYRLGDRLFFLCPSMKKHYRVSGGSWNQCIPSASPYQPAKPAALFYLPSTDHKNPLHLVGIGSLIPRKGWHLIVEAMAQLTPSQRARFHVTHCGDTPQDPDSQAYASRLLQRCEELKIAQHFSWLGFVEDVPALIRSCDISLIPSYNEPLSLAMLESLFAGRPILAADSGGPSDLVRPGENGWLFHTGSAGSLAKVLRQILDDHSTMHRTPTPDWVRAFTPAFIGQRWGVVYAAVWDFASRRRP